jgi:hypothetical protein
MSATTPHLLPDDFLTGPAPNLTINKVDFTQTPLPEYHKYYAVVLDGVLSPSECQQLLAAAESTTNGQWERAMINIGGGRQMIATDVRNCGRIIWDDEELVGRLWKRIEAALVEDLGRLEGKPLVTGMGSVKGKQIWVASRLNERMRFLKYTKGEYFKGV